MIVSLSSSATVYKVYVDHWVDGRYCSYSRINRARREKVVVLITYCSSIEIAEKWKTSSVYLIFGLQFPQPELSSNSLFQSLMSHRLGLDQNQKHFIIVFSQFCEIHKKSEADVYRSKEAGSVGKKIDGRDIKLDLKVQDRSVVDFCFDEG